MVYETIIRTAPNLKAIFNRPPQVMAMKVRATSDLTCDACGLEFSPYASSGWFPTLWRPKCDLAAQLGATFNVPSFPL